MSPVLLDANVFLHALGADAALRAACRRVLARVEAGDLMGEVSAVAIDEIVHVRNRKLGDRRLAVTAGRAAARLCVVRPVAPEDVEAAMTLFLENPRLDMRDAIHVAVARRYGVLVVVTTDRGFDDVAGLTRVDPVDEQAVGQLVDG